MIQKSYCYNEENNKIWSSGLPKISHIRFEEQISYLKFRVQTLSSVSNSVSARLCFFGRYHRFPESIKHSQTSLLSIWNRQNVCIGSLNLFFNDMYIISEYNVWNSQSFICLRYKWSALIWIHTMQFFQLLLEWFSFIYFGSKIIVGELNL